MALITNSMLKEEIKKFNRKFLKSYLSNNNYRLKKYKYQEVLYTLPYLAFVFNRSYMKDAKEVYKLFSVSHITDVFYDFYFLETTQHTLYDLDNNEFKIEEFKKSIFKLFSDFSEKLADMLHQEIEAIRNNIKKSTLTNLICLLMSYFYTDDIIGNFGPDINKLTANEQEYNKNVDLFTLKLEYFKQIQEIIIEADPHTFNYLICGINMISKDHIA